jgi:hypothetical protein
VQRTAAQIDVDAWTAHGDAPAGSAAMRGSVLAGADISIATNSARAPSAREAVVTGDFGASLAPAA